MVPFDKSTSLFAQNEDRALSPDLLMPAQYYEPRPTSPYYNLLLATLGDSIRCYQHNLDAKTARRRNLFQETENWLFEADVHRFHVERDGVRKPPDRLSRLEALSSRMAESNECSAACVARRTAPPSVRHSTEGPARGSLSERPGAESESDQ